MPEAALLVSPPSHLGERGRRLQALFHAALVDDRPSQGLEALAQGDEPLLVGDKLLIAGIDPIGLQGLQPGGRWHVGAGGEAAAETALLLLREIPGEKELRRVGMRRQLEDAGGDEE